MTTHANRYGTATTWVVLANVTCHMLRFLSIVARDRNSEDCYVLVVLLWSPYGIGQTIIFSCCYYGRPM